MSLKPWREIIAPHPDVLNGTFQQSEFAADLTRRIDSGAQLFVLAIGPADGWSAAARSRADR